MWAVSAPTSVQTGCTVARPASIREKSSSESTIRSRRCALRRAVVSRSARIVSGPASASASSSGPEQQCQRRAELVADIGQKGRLGPVQFGKRVGSLPLLLIGDRRRERRRQLVGEKLAKAAIESIEG